MNLSWTHEIAIIINHSNHFKAKASEVVCMAKSAGGLVRYGLVDPKEGKGIEDVEDQKCKELVSPKEASADEPEIGRCTQFFDCKGDHLRIVSTTYAFVEPHGSIKWLLCECLLHPVSPKSSIPCPKAWKFASMLTMLGSLHLHVRAAKENLKLPRCLYRSIRSWKSGCPVSTCHSPCRCPSLLFSPCFSALLRHICRCGQHTGSQANFTSGCKRVLAPIPEIKFKMLLGSVETCHPPVISVGLVTIFFPSILTAENLRNVSGAWHFLMNWLRKHLGLLQDEGF